MRQMRWPVRLGGGLVLLALLAALAPCPVFALDLNPLDYYDIDYQIVFSDDEVEPAEEFAVTVGAAVRCTADLPFGADEATVVVSGVARLESADVEYVLLDDFELVIPDVPDWQGDTFEMEETVELLFPGDAVPGTYEIVATLERVSIDGWNITGFVPAGYRSLPIGPIAVATAEGETEPPTPPPSPGHLNLTLLGHEYSPEIDGEGVVAEDVSAVLIEGEVSFLLDEGTECLDASDEPLSYISLVHKSSPAPYEDGMVLAAYSLYPNGATFSPALTLAIRYEDSDLPEDVTPDDLTLAWYEDGAWSPVTSSLDDDVETVRANIRHFSTVGLLASTTTPSPAEFVIEDLHVSPTTVSPLANVYVTFTVRNTGGASGTYPLTVEVNGSSAYARELTLSPSESQHVRFWLARSTAGAYIISVDGVTSAFTVVSNAPAVSAEDAQAESSSASASQAPVQNTDTGAANGIHPAIIALLVMAGVAFLTLVILLLAGVL